MAPRISKAPEIGTFNETPAACTQLACGADCVVTIGLCGRLRAWRTDGTGWQLVVDESSAFELANNRTSSHPYKFLTQISADGRFAAATTAAARGASRAPASVHVGVTCDDCGMSPQPWGKVCEQHRGHAGLLLQHVTINLDELRA